MGRIIGTPASSLVNPSWAASKTVAAAGAKGERLTGDVLNRLASLTEVTVLHDLVVPGYADANIDHVVVAGRQVVVVESKCWKPGFYFTIAGRTYRDGRRFSFAEKRGVPAQIAALNRYLGQTRARVTPRAWQVIWPSSPEGKLSLWALRLPGARAIGGESFAARARKLFDDTPGDAKIVHQLSLLSKG